MLSGTKIKTYDPPAIGSTLWNKYYCLIILIACCTSFGNHFAGSSLSLWLIDMGKSNTTYGTIHSLFSLVAMLARPVTGWIIDHGDRKKAFIISTLVYAVSLILMLYSPIFGLFVAMRLIQGAGNGCAYTICTSSTYDYIPPDKMEKGVGYLALSSSVISALTASISVQTYNNHGPSAVVACCVAAFIVGIILSFFVVFRTPCERQPFRIKDVFNINTLFEKSALGPSLLAIFSVNFAFGLRSYIILYGRSIGIRNPGLFTTISAIGLILVRLVLDAMPVKKGTRSKRVCFAFAVFFVYLVVLGFCKNIYMFLGAAVLWSIVYGIIYPQLQSLSVKYSSPDRRGACGSTFLCATDIGIIMGSLVGGILADLVGYQYMFLFALLPVIICFIVFILKLRKKLDQD